MKLSGKLVAAAAVLGLVMLPTVASATSLTVTASGSAVTSMELDDVVTVTATSPIDTSGSISQSIAGVWSHESLQLTDPNSVIYPEGWALEATTDGENWDSIANIIDMSAVIGLRTVGDVKTSGNNNAFETKATADPVVTTTNFQGASGGDGYSVTFSSTKIFNVFHHDSSLRIDCHLKKTGESCYEGITQFTGYTTGNASEAYWYAKRSELWIQSMNADTNKGGLACVDFSSTPKMCVTPFVELGAVRTAHDLSVSTRIGNKIYIVNQNDWKLLCMDIAAGTACANNGFALPNNGASPNSGGSIDNYRYGRAASAGDGKVYWSTYNKLGCYDPATNDICGTATNISALGGQYPLFPVRNAAGALQGMCFFPTQQCINSSGTVVTPLPTALSNWMNAHPLPDWNTFNAGVWAEQSNKIYFEVGPSDTAGSDVYCFDYTTGAACAGFSGANVGQEIYAIVADPSIPNCLWTNGNQGQITSFNGTTGIQGCSLPYPVVEMPYNAIAPRMACDETGRVIKWESIKFNAPSGVSPSSLSVTILDASGAPITGWTDVHPSSTGVLDMSSLTVTETGTKATIQVNAGIGITAEELATLTAIVKFQAEDPQLCFNLTAVTSCPEFTPAPGDTSVPDGLIQITSISTSTSGTPLATGEQEKTLAGTNVDTVCPPTLMKQSLPELPTKDLADTGGDSYLGIMALLAALLVAGGTVVVIRSRRS